MKNALENALTMTVKHVTKYCLFVAYVCSTVCYCLFFYPVRQCICPFVCTFKRENQPPKNVDQISQFYAKNYIPNNAHTSNIHSNCFNAICLVVPRKKYND